MCFSRGGLLSLLHLNCCIIIKFHSSIDFCCLTCLKSVLLKLNRFICRISKYFSPSLSSMFSLLLRQDVIVHVTALCCSYKIYLLRIFILCLFIDRSGCKTNHFLLHSSRWRYITLSLSLALYSIRIFLNHSLNKEKRKINI